MRLVLAKTSLTLLNKLAITYVLYLHGRKTLMVCSASGAYVPIPFGGVVRERVIILRHEWSGLITKNNINPFWFYHCPFYGTPGTKIYTLILSQ